MIINTNVNAMNAHRNSVMNISTTGKSMEKLSSGLRINRAGDDAAGLSISEKMRGQIRGLDQANRNVQDGISYIQTAEGALNEVSSMLVRMKELSVQKANGTNSTADKTNLELEMTQLGEEMDKIINDTEFNKTKVFDGTVNIVTSDKDTDTLAVGKAQGALSLNNASTTSAIEGKIDEINTTRSTFGAHQNRLEHRSNSLTITSENLTAAESRIRDTDMAKEMVKFSKSNILQQAAQAMLSQANQQPQGVLQLLR